MAEWSNARDSKSRPFGGPGSNPGVIASVTSFFHLLVFPTEIVSRPATTAWAALHVRVARTNATISHRLSALFSTHDYQVKIKLKFSMWSEIWNRNYFLFPSQNQNIVSATTTAFVHTISVREKQHKNIETSFTQISIIKTAKESLKNEKYIWKKW